MHSVHQMWTIDTDDACSVVCMSVCLSVGWSRGCTLQKCIRWGWDCPTGRGKLGGCLTHRKALESLLRITQLSVVNNGMHAEGIVQSLTTIRHVMRTLL